jgi:hypothetical protein
MPPALLYIIDIVYSVADRRHGLDMPHISGQFKYVRIGHIYDVR